MNRQLLLGLFFLSALGVLGFYTLFLADFNPFGTQEELGVHFREAHGLREGDPVMVAGMRIGRVKSLTLDPAVEEPERRITAVLALSQPISLYEGFSVVIEESTLLGGRNVNIDPSRPRPELPDLGRVQLTGAPLQGSIAANPLEALQAVGTIAEENRAALARTVANIEAITADVKGGAGVLGMLVSDAAARDKLTSAIDRIDGAAANVQSITDDLRSGRGTIGKLLVEDAVYEDLKQGLDDLAQALAGARSGRSPMGRLFYDEELGAALSQAIFDMRGVMGGLARGEGSLGRFLNDSTVADNLARFTNDLAQGRGALAQLVSDEDTAAKVRAIVDNVQAVTAALRNADGSLGKLMMESELYDQAVIAVKLLNRSLEDYREAAPVSTFTSVLFGAL
jgi:phospholipid/cholesterol/gamma-HCH transport system substrate-binding protein